MTTLEWHASTLDVENEVGRYFDFVGQWAWSPDQDGGRYAYLYGESDKSGLFVRYDLQDDIITELTGYDEQPGPVFRTSHSGSGSTSCSVLGIGTQPGDLEIMAVESTDSSTAGGTPNTPSGWTKIFEETQAEGAAGVTTLTIFAKISNSSASVTVDGVLDHLTVVRSAYYNHGVTDVSTDIIVGTGNGANTGNATILDVTTTVARSMVVMVLASTRDSTSATFSAWANSNLIHIADGAGRIDENGTITGVGGVVGMIDGIKVTAGATGNSTVTIAVSDKWRGVHLVVPPSAVASSWYKSFHSSAIYNGKVYFFAGDQGYPGRTGGGDETPDTWIYDIATDTWDADGAPMKKNDYSGSLGAGTGEDRIGASATTIGTKIYVAAGFGSGTNGDVNNRTDRYDPVADTWTQRDYMNFGADLPAIVQDGSGRLHSFAGSFTEAAPRHERYDPGTNAWTSLSDITDAEHGGNVTDLFQGAVVYDSDLNQIVFTVFQNFSADPAFMFTGRYNPDADTWESETNQELFIDVFDTNLINSAGNIITEARYGGKSFYLGHHDGFVFGGDPTSGIFWYEFPAPTPSHHREDDYYDALGFLT